MCIMATFYPFLATIVPRLEATPHLAVRAAHICVVSACLFLFVNRIIVTAASKAGNLQVARARRLLRHWPGTSRALWMQQGSRREGPASRAGWVHRLVWACAACTKPVCGARARLCRTVAMSAASALVNVACVGVLLRMECSNLRNRRDINWAGECIGIPSDVPRG